MGGGCNGAVSGIRQIACVTAENCSLNGVCDGSTGRCTCDKGWRGYDCSRLDLHPTPRTAGCELTGHLPLLVIGRSFLTDCCVVVDNAPSVDGTTEQAANSSWGGSIVKAHDGVYLMFAAQLAQQVRMIITLSSPRSTHHPILTFSSPNPHLLLTSSSPSPHLILSQCGIAAWEPTSLVVRAHSHHLLGPYHFDEVIIPNFAHEPVAARAGGTGPNGAGPVMLFHIGRGNSTRTFGNCSLCVGGRSPDPIGDCTDVPGFSPPIRISYAGRFSPLCPRFSIGKCRNCPFFRAFY